jgi:filamentous hemagglutinin family protein
MTRTSLFSIVIQILGCFVLWLFYLPIANHVQAAAPITPSGLNTDINLSQTPPAGTTHYDITGGTRPGGGTNLFHSFGDFNVPHNNIANFLNGVSFDGNGNPLSAGLPTSNILGRVTGGDTSTIFGTIQTTGFGNANLFLMNPAGFLFGPTATINVGGMMAFTSADYMKLADGARLTAIPNAATDALLTASPVAAFGFVGSNPGAITVQGSQFTVSEGQGFSLVGGDIAIQSAHLSAPGGDINLASVASPGEILAGTLKQSPNINGQTFGALGTIQISQKSGIDASGTGGGTVSIRGGQLVMNDSAIAANTIDSATGPLPAINGGVVTLSASDIRLEYGATIRTDSENTGNAGTITIQGVTGKESIATNVVLDNATLSTTIHGGDTASTPGSIAITADIVTLNNGTYMTADTHGASLAGTITFNVGTLITQGSGPIRLHVFPESLITNPIISETGVLIESTSTSLDAAAGRGGQIIIQGANGSGSVAKNVNLNDTILHARVFGGTGVTMPSAITVTADSLALSDQVEMYATSNSDAPAGNVTLNANTLRSNLNPDGSFIEGRPVLIGSPSEKSDRAAGPPGIVTISGTDPEPNDPAKLIALSNTEIDTFIVSGSTPTPGPIITTADTVVLSNRTIFVTISNGEAPAGIIVFNVNNLRVNMNQDGTPMTSAKRVFLNSPSGSLDSTGGPPGTVTISGIAPEATDPAKLIALYNAQISTTTEGGRSGLPPGTITITADTMTMSGRSSIFSATLGPAPAGDIVLNVNQLRANVQPDDTLINDGQPRSLLANESLAKNETAGRAGTVTVSGLGPESTDLAKLIALNNIEVSTAVKGGTAARTPASITMAADTIRMTNSPNIHTDTSSGAPAGHMTFNVNNLSADHATQIRSSTTGPGLGGTITIAAGQSVTLNNGSSISANSTDTGNAGNISINAGQQLDIMGNSSVKTEAAQTSGGNIDIQAVDRVRLVNSSISTSVLGGMGSGGNITIDPNVVVLQNSTVKADAVLGSGGNITIFTPLFLADSSSLVSASSQRGVNGTVTIQNPTSNLSETLGTLPSEPNQAQALLTQRCAALASGQASSFIVAGREQLPADPGGWLTSPLAFAALGGSLDTDYAVASAPTIMAMATQDTGTVSLRRLTPAGFLMAHFSESEATGCRS